MTKKSPEDVFRDILDTIEKQFTVEPVRDEADFESQLFQFLKATYGAGRIERQVPFRVGRLDILIDNKYVLELKLADSPANLRSLTGQLIEYKQEYPNVAAVILDTGSVGTQDIDYYTQLYEKQGASVIVLRGNRRGKRGRGGININIPR